MQAGTVYDDHGGFSGECSRGVMFSKFRLQFMRFFYHQLYHRFAWTYDLVSWTVSYGQWQQWGRSVIPYLPGVRILELGYGPGYLQRDLHRQGIRPVGLDESAQMAAISRKRIERVAAGKARLVRGLAQAMPFAGETFDTIAATFPSEYLFMPETLAEVHRLLRPGGQLVVLAGVRIVSASIPGRVLAGIYRITGQSPADESIDAALQELFVQCGLSLKQKWIQGPLASLYLLAAEKEPAGGKGEQAV